MKVHANFKYRYVKDREELAAHIHSMNCLNAPVVLDIETTGLDRFKDKLVSVQLCIAGEHEAIYFDANLVEELNALSTPIICHNFKFDFAFLLTQCGIDLRRVGLSSHTGEETGASEGTARVIHDTMLLHHLLDENAPHDLDSLVKERWQDNYKEEFWAAHTSFQEAPEDARLAYACKDSIYTGLLFEQLLKDLEVSQVPKSLHRHVHKLALALFDTEVRGVRVDLDYLVKVGEDLKVKIAAARSAMRSAAPECETVELQNWIDNIEKAQANCKTEKGKAAQPHRIKREEFNWDSNQQLQRLIYGELGLKPVMKWDKKTKTRKPTLDDAALEILEDDHHLIPILRDYRGHQKTYSSFIEGTLQCQSGGVVYPSFNVNGTPTGRISHAEPNLAQLPAEGGIRGIYIPSPGCKFVGADYGMIEVVVAAHYSQDKNLLKIIYEGASKHDITAAGMGIPRQTAKRLNFAIGYGATEFKVAQILGCSVKEAKEALDKYWETYEGEKKVIDECTARVDRGEPIIGLYGRRRRFPKVFSSNKDRGRVYRQAYNSLIQGSAADITHQAYYETAHYLERERVGRTIVEIHDQILAEAKEERAQEALDKICQIMTSIAGKVGLSVPITVDPQGPMDRWED